MYLPVPGSFHREGMRSPSNRDRFVSARSRRAAPSDAATPASAPSSATSSNPYGARRTHRKVRTGCKKCKERKIKCDEAKPECWQCKRHNVPCDFVNSRPSSVSSLSPNANETAGVVAASAAAPAARSPGATSPGVSTGEPTAVNVVAPAGDGSGGVSMPPNPSAAAAAFAFLEWSLSASKDAPAAAGEHQPFAQIPQAAPITDPVPAPSPSPFPPLGAPVTCLAAQDDLEMNMTDLSLLHHFTTSTASDLNPWHAGLQDWWTHEVPRVAFRYPFVMRSLLALAGLHVAYLTHQRQQAPPPVATTATTTTTGGSAAAPAGGVPMVGIGSTVGAGPASSPGESYSSQASQEAKARAFHISRAIEQHKLAGQTASSMLLDLNRSTSAPMYVFSVVTLIISMAMPRQAAPAYSWDGTGVQEWTRLMRGVKEIANLSQSWLVEGDMLCGTFDDRVLPQALEREQQKRRARVPLPGVGSISGIHDFNFGGGDGGGKRRSRWYLMHEPPLAQLREVAASGLLDAAEGGEDREARQLCVTALDDLQHVFQSFLDHGETVQTARLIFSWLCQVDQRFLDNLGRHNPPSLLLFSYFGVLLRWTDRAWWLEGWGPHIVESISNILGGADMPSRYKEWLRWPREQIGLASIG